MAKTRKFCAYRRLERPYTRFSKFRAKSYIRARPNCRVVRFDMGTDAKEFSTVLDLVVKDDLQIRDNALESARQTSNRVLEKKIGKNEYKYKMMVYPHHVLRENPLASGAGADRMSTGMKCSFGKAIGIAAQLKKGQAIFRVMVNRPNVATARVALKRASQKLPCTCSIVQK